MSLDNPVTRTRNPAGLRERGGGLGLTQSKGIFSPGRTYLPAVVVVVAATIFLGKLNNDVLAKEGLPIKVGYDILCILYQRVQATQARKR